MIPGTTVNLGGTDYLLPPLSLGQLRNGVLALMKRHDELIASEDGSERWEACCIRGEIVGHALKRNYPDLTDEQVMELLDTKTTNDAWLIVLGASGFPQQEVAGAALPGTSDPSIAPSPESTAGQ